MNGLGEDDLITELSCDRDALNRLRLCSRPGSDPVSFRSDIETIASRIGVDGARLASIVRSVELLDVFGGAGEAGPFLGEYGKVMKAARDRETLPQMVREEPEEYTSEGDNGEEEPEKDV